MLTTNILLAEKYDYLSEKFKKAFTFLRDTDLAALPVGNVPIDGNEVYANVQSYSTMDAADCPFESHKEYVPPEDGHAPRRMTANGSCHVKKIVVKVRV